MRHKVNGWLNVYRESSLSTKLSATLKVDGKTFYYHPVPKCFDDIIVDGQDNLKEVSVTINEDGKNPRNCSLI